MVLYRARNKRKHLLGRIYPYIELEQKQQKQGYLVLFHYAQEKNLLCAAGFLFFFFLIFVVIFLLYSHFTNETLVSLNGPV